MSAQSESDARRHVENASVRLQELAAHLRRDLAEIDDPRARALFETAAEVLTGLNKAFADYERKSEAAWVE